MSRSWSVLAALTLARTAMGFQFQSVAALGPQLSGDLGLSFALIGSLIGLYLLPGVGVALPGGWLGQRFGDKRVVMIGLGLMVLGGAALALPSAPGMMFSGRLISGIGAVLLNVLVTKMVADWFSGRSLVLAMGVLISSWPFGIAVAMGVVPRLAEAASPAAAMLSGAAAALAALLLVWRGCGPAPATAGPGGPSQTSLSRHELLLAVLAGAVWAFYNIGFITLLAFGPDLLAAQGKDPIAAADMVSLIGWLIIPSLAAGGWIAGLTGRTDVTIAACLLLVTALIWTLPESGQPLILLVLIGLLFGPPGPLIMTLPVAAVRPTNRAVGVGIYFTCYYVGMALAPPLAGLSRDLTGLPAAPLWFAGAALVAACAALVGFRAVQRHAPAAPG